MTQIGHNGGPTFSSDGGWIAVARSMRNHPIVGFHLFAKPSDPSRGALQPSLAFIDLIMECRYEGGSVMNGGHKMEITRGQLLGAVSWLAKRWNWTPMAVRVWLDKLENDGMISRHVPGASKDNKHVGRQATVLTLCNYNQYQVQPTNKQQTEQQTNSKQATNEQQQYKDNKETKEQGNKKEKDSCAASAAPGNPIGVAFEEFWQAFPSERRRSKGKCRDLFVAIATGRHAKRRAKAADIVAAAKAGNGIDPEYPPLPETWLNGGRWEDAPVAAATDPKQVDGKPWGWWRGLEDRLRARPVDVWRKALDEAKPNGTWPWWKFGPPPGDAQCLVPKEIITERKYDEIYQGRITHA